MKSQTLRSSALIILCAMPGYCASFFWGNWLNSLSCYKSFFADFFANRGGVYSIVSSNNFWEARTICLDPYWQNQWIKTYEYGLVKRGLLGTILKLLLGREVNILFLNILFPLIGFVLLCALIFSVFKLSLLRGRGLALFTILLSLSPVAKVIAETSGDPLHVVALLCFSSVLISYIFLNSNIQATQWLYIFIYITCILIYEGSYLLLLPLLFYDLKIDKKRILCFGLSTLLLVWFSRPESAELGVGLAESISVYNPANGLNWSYEAGGGVSTSVGFLFNAKNQLGIYLDNPIEYVFRMARGFVPFLSIFFILGIFLRARSIQVMSTFFRENCLVFLCGLPFFAINHDYFRYWVFVIFVATFITFGVLHSHPYSLDLASKSHKISASLIWISFLPLTLFVFAGPFSEDLRVSFPRHAFWGSLFVLTVAYWAYTMMVKKLQPLEESTRRS